MSLLADFLEKSADDLVSRWKTRLVEQSKGKSRSEVGNQDHIPQFLTEAVLALRGGETSVRDPHEGFDVEELLTEYDMFRSVVFGAADEAKITVTIGEMQIFADLVARAVARGVAKSRELEREHLAQELGAAEAKWSLVADSLPVLISFVTRDERYGLVNEAYTSWFGLTREQLIGRTVREVIGEEAYAVLGPHVRRGLAGESFSFEQQNVPYRHGGTRDVKVSFVARRDAKGNPDGYVALLEDVTTQRRLESQLMARAEFERQLIGIVSHDLRNPLNVVLMASQLLTRQPAAGPSSGAPVDERTTKLLTRIEGAAQSATRLVRDLLDFTQARIGGGISVARREADAHALVQAVVEELELGFPERAIDVIRDGDCSGAWDPDRLTQIVQNLLTNAIKYSPADSRITVRLTRQAGPLTLAVHNGGTPIPADKLPRVFESFERAGADGHDHDRAARSVGLGLYIVQQIAVAHGGTVAIESNAAAGTTVTVILPPGVAVD